MGRSQFNIEAADAGGRRCNPGDEVSQDDVVLGDAKFTDIAGNNVGDFVAFSLLPEHQAGFVNIIECISHENDHVLAIACVTPDVFFPLLIVVPGFLNLGQDAGSDGACRYAAFQMQVLEDLDAFFCHVGWTNLK
ncbi:hypothetical protein C667_00060 [Thauera phenylacetica B4P]|uniref:Uncharacterized protein n=1 Tax=Thauera phenylacetica B4P TaxID=1234382 RepID=N6YXL4_9RHOO|nr:hypothetical protein C667_00060 [Thauera phenylacetica B4P]